MDFITESFSFASRDGKVLLRACIDRPLNSAHSAFKYLNSYSCAIRAYVNDRLFLRAQEVYDSNDRDKVRFFPFLYTFKCTVTYSDDAYLSCAMIAMLSQATNMISQSLDSVVFFKDQILPPKLLHYVNRNQKLVIDADGIPCIADMTEGKVVVRRVGKNSILK